MTADSRSALEIACAEMITEANDLSDQLRSKKLRSLNILEAPSIIYDDLVRLAAQVAEMPSAALTFIDTDKAIVANCFTPPDREQFPTPLVMDRCETVCNTTIMKPNDVNLVLDARLDVRFCNLPAAKSGAMRFYCGVAVVTDDGVPLGALCVFDTVPRTIEEDKVESLRAIARTIMQIILLNSVKTY